MLKPTLKPGGRLLQFIEAKYAELPALALRYPLAALEQRLASRQEKPIGFLQAITPTQPQHVCLIAELKPSSPSQGPLQPVKQTLERILPAYNTGGVNALSVLTEPSFFGGSPELFEQVGQGSPLPRLWKDFVLKPYQLTLAAALGASAVLLIVKALQPEDLHALYHQALALNLAPVLEVQSEAEVEQALPLNPDIVLINHRNLETLVMDLETTPRLAPLVPKGTVIIAASGLSTPQQLRALAPYTQTFLIGSSLMQSNQLPSLLASLKQSFTA